MVSAVSVQLVLESLIPEGWPTLYIIGAGGVAALLWSGLICEPSRLYARRTDITKHKETIT